jgi:betaine-aldehyde dehydrogenase
VETPARRGTVIAEVPRAAEADVDRAVKAAAKAFESWKRMAPRERGKLMQKIAADMEAQSEDLAKTLSLETGNAIRTQSRGEIALAADLFRFYGGVAVSKKVKPFLLVNSFMLQPSNPSVWCRDPWNSPVLRST